MSVARQLLIVQTVALAVVVLVAGGLFAVEERRDADAATRLAVTDVAATTAQIPAVAADIVGPDPVGALQPVASAIRAATGVDFVVVMGLDEIRLTHPRPDRIGLPYTGHTEPARQGRTFTETYTGSLGPSIRAVAPVYEDTGALVGFVSVGVTRQKSWEQFRDSLPGLLGIVAIGLAVSTAGAVLVSRRLRTQTLGLSPDQLRRLYEQHDAVLRAIGDGLLVFGTSGGDGPRVDVINDEARRLLGLPADGPVSMGSLPETVRALAEDGDDARDEVHLTADRVLVVGRDAVRWEGRRIGTVVTLRDHTELRSVLGELDSVRGLAESLQAQAHESANRLHTIITMVELGRPDEAVAFATEELRLSQQLVDRVTATVADPALAALLIGKVDAAAERGVELTVTDDTALAAVPLRSRDLVTVVGNLVDNAIDAVSGTEDAWVEVTVRQERSTVVIEVADSGPGMDPDTLARSMTRGYSTKSDHHGLGLALVAQTITRRGGTLRTEPSLGSLVVAEIPFGGAP
ncbi:ATP-binding protein [Rhodococcus sp. NPDC058532]|uniref:sensor histidine kinase n=1 Tax=Rhodococcus sp. NPDC058532 TaxID=3346540 RepID=UPI00365ED4C3